MAQDFIERISILESILLENNIDDEKSNAILQTYTDNENLPVGRRAISIEALIDALIVLYDECCNSSLRREKTVSDFIKLGKY